MGYMRKDGESTKKTDAVIPGPTEVVKVVSTSLAYLHSTLIIVNYQLGAQFLYFI
jgi:hypothetical protein